MPVQQRRPSLSRAAAALVGVALPLLAAGCDHAKAQTATPEVVQSESGVDLLRRENAALRNRVQGLEERVRLLENGGGKSWGSTSLGTTGYDSYGAAAGPDDGAWETSEYDGPRELPVVKLTPNERRSAQATNVAKPSAQPAGNPGRSKGSITLSPLPNSGAPEQHGSSYVVDARGGDDQDDNDYVDAPDDAAGEPASYRLVGSKLVQATQRKPTASAGPSDRDSGVAKDYKAAMAVYKDGRYADAEQAFAAIVGAHPNHDYADNALYWQGEAAYDQAHYADALAAFTTVVERYGGGNKAPDALLKIGLCYGRLGDAANARDVLTQLVAAYPRAEASKIAKRKLADLGD
ncbi:tol-pal system protein YbgF [Enhygromyxa salina]|uniref:Tol-pal system protein YbgF n=1 Tax=Enhygromyxa salina TaxID=215803 RepID=A0A2S9YPZ1_9BACT|nr:tol-pal system protein YbgF [Enhygromyxa salina]PRQ07119.1 tol-pal system protein YbgF [Enhygromyxa salina]